MTDQVGIDVAAVARMIKLPMWRYSAWIASGPRGVHVTFDDRFDGRSASFIVESSMSMDAARSFIEERVFLFQDHALEPIRDLAVPLTCGVFDGPLHVHFNRHGAAPLVWSVHPADERWEVAVKRVVLDGVLMTSVYRPKATPDDEDGKPSAWFEVTGRLELDAEGTATIRPL